MTSPKVIRSFEALPEEFYVRQPTIGRMHEAAKKLTRPTSLNELYTELQSESSDQKIYEDKKLTCELVLRLPDLDTTAKVPALAPSKSSISGCREYFLNHLIPELHYVYGEGLQELYNDTFREGVVRKLLLEIQSQDSFELDANIANVVNFLLSDKENLKWVAETTIPQISKQQMLKRYIEHSISIDRIALGLEISDPNLLDMTAIKQYEQDVEKIRKRFTLSEQEVERNRMPARKKAVSRVVDRLKLAGQWVLINAEFHVDKTSAGDFCFEFLHPVSDYWGSNVRILILEVPEEEFARGFSLQYSKLVGRKKPMNIFGNVFQPLTDSEPFDYMVKPYAIF